MCACLRANHCPSLCVACNALLGVMALLRRGHILAPGCQGHNQGDCPRA